MPLSAFDFFVLVNHDIYQFQIAQDNYDFFPLNRAMSLINLEDDDSDKTMDTLLDQVNFIARKIRHQVNS